MVTLVQWIRKLEKNMADRVVYQSSAEELAEATAILVACGAVKTKA